MNKNDELELEIIDEGVFGEGIAKHDGFTIFIPNTLKEEKVKVKILKVKGNIAYGKAIDIINRSKKRIDSDCKYYGLCGGCDLRHVDYDYSLKLKEDSLKKTLLKATGMNFEIDDVLKADNTNFYRNKLVYPVGVDKDNSILMGTYAQRSHRIINIDKCMIQNEACQDIANTVYQYLKSNNIPGYNEETLEGLVRHVLVRIGVKTGEIMLILVLTKNNFSKKDEFIKEILDRYPNIKTIIFNINSKNTNVILGDKNCVIYGDGFIYDYIGDKKFKIAPDSFYQVNPYQTEKLYSKAIEYASIKEGDTIFDLYSGVGTIGICAYRNGCKLYGIECIKSAINNAKENALINGINDATFYVRKCRRHA